MYCREIMTQDVEFVTPEDTIQTAAEKMRDHAIGFLPVIDKENRLCGTITDRDLTIRALADALPVDSLVAGVMTSEIVACSPDDDLDAAEKLMSRLKKSRILCVEAGRVVGVISLSDIAQAEGVRKSGKILRDVTEREART